MCQAYKDTDVCGYDAAQGLKFALPIKFYAFVAALNLTKSAQRLKLKMLFVRRRG